MYQGLHSWASLNHSFTSSQSVSKRAPAAPTEPVVCSRDFPKQSPQKLVSEKGREGTTILNGHSMDPNGCVPGIHVQRASGGIEDAFIDKATSKWHCCNCHAWNHVFMHPGDHPLGALACDCPHKSCSTCTMSGQVKAFLPIEEPAMVPCGDFGHDGVLSRIPFGIVCPACGLSWRVREFGKRFSKTLRKMNSMSLSQAVRLAPVESKLRKCRSTLVLGNRRIVTPPGKGLAKQAEYAAVRFSGIVCTCGHGISLKSAFCFQIVGEQQLDEREKEFRGLWRAEGYWAGWTTTPELHEKGHGTATLKIGKVEHPHPLRSAPVLDRMARELWEERCDKEGWV